MVVINKRNGKEINLSPVVSEREKFVTLAKAKAAELGLVFCDAIFTNQPILETAGLLRNVLVKLPPADDKCLKFCPEHQCVVPSNSNCTEIKIIKVDNHYHRSLPFPGGKKVFRNFYMGADSLGQKVLADVCIRIKKDYSRNEESFVLDYYPADPGAKPEYEITIGTNEGQLQIFGTDKFIKAEKITRTI
ncbi:MAG: hypothetical protein WC719_02705 [Patescibacteria group bacterium]|jgi:hypothetical protein